MAAHAFFVPNTSLTFSFYARSIDAEDRCTVSKFLNDWFTTSRLAHGSQYGSHHASWWKVKKAVPDQSVLFDEVMGGSLQRAFALCAFILQCSSVGGDRNEAAGPDDDSAINTLISLLVIRAEN